MTWTNLRHLADVAGISAEGHFDGRPGLPDARAARRAISYLREAFPDLDGIVLVRDQDDEPERRDGLEQARREDHSGLPIVVGLAVVEREAWVISGFEPRDDEERGRLDAEHRTLGFDPRLRSHDLTAGKDDQAKRSPKRVLQVLSGDDRERECACWRDTPLHVLRTRGADNGLADFLGEIRDRLAPLLGYVPQG